jgi:hypothetical protein
MCGLFMASSVLQPAARWGGELWNLNLEADKLRHTSPGCHPPRINISKCWVQNDPNFSTLLSAVIQNKLAGRAYNYGSIMAGSETAQNVSVANTRRFRRAVACPRSTGLLGSQLETKVRLVWPTTVFTATSLWTLSWVRRIQCTISHPLFLKIYFNGNA